MTKEREIIFFHGGIKTTILFFKTDDPHDADDAIWIRPSFAERRIFKNITQSKLFAGVIDR